jgi:DNA-binding MarR family transcriptional regulator
MKENQSNIKAYKSGSMSEIFKLIESVERKLKNWHKLTIQKTHLTPPQYFILNILWKKDKRTFKDLAETAYCSRPTITGIVDTLEKKGLVRREQNPDDRRSLYAKLSEKGKKLKDTTPTLDIIFKNCCVSMEQAELNQLSTLLKKLDTKLNF